VASNGQERYVSEIVRQLNMEGLFDDLYSAGKFKTASKVDLVRLLLDQHGLETAWMVGDRSSDVEAGVCNRLPVVGCLYAAFGADAELEGSTFLIRSFDALMEIVAIVEKG
jgi:phosphoglycolate phosphatase-like HAD superfamily hydrolase